MYQFIRVLDDPWLTQQEIACGVGIKVMTIVRLSVRRVVRCLLSPLGWSLTASLRL